MSREPRRATASEIFSICIRRTRSNVAYILMMSYLTYYMTVSLAFRRMPFPALCWLPESSTRSRSDDEHDCRPHTVKTRPFRPYLIFGALVLDLQFIFFLCSLNILNPKGFLCISDVYSLLTGIDGLQYSISCTDPHYDE